MKLAVLTLLAGVGSIAALAQDNFSTKDFTKSPTEHIINRIDEPFVVRSIRGYISDLAQEPVPEVLFELQGIGPDRRIRKAVTDKKGRLAIKGVKDETYHFKATKNGWQSVIGTITVSGKANKNARIKIELHVGV